MKHREIPRFERFKSWDFSYHSIAGDNLYISRAVWASNAKAMNIIIEKANNDDPPYEISGNGIPITGTKPMVIPTLMSVWKSNTEATI